MKIGLKQVLGLCLTWILTTQAFSWFGFNRLQLTEVDKRDYLPGADAVYDPHPLDFLEMHARFDSAWYFSIAYAGYSYTPDTQSNINFFPLYPLLMRGLKNVIAPFSSQTLYHQYLVAGVIVSIVSTLIAIPFIYSISRNYTDSDSAFLSIILLLSFPASYFLTAIYSESLSLLLSVLCIFFLIKKRYLPSAIFGLLASLARPVGVLLVIPYFYYLLTNKYRGQKLFISILMGLLIPLGVLIYAYYLNLQFGNPWLFLSSQKLWGSFDQTSQTISNSITTALSFTDASAASLIQDIFFFLFGLIGSSLVMKKLNFGLGLWCLISVLVPPILHGTLISQGRYTQVLFPIFIVLAKILRPRPTILYSYLLISILLLSLNIILFVNGYWSG